MKKDRKLASASSIAYTYVGTVVGAGFGSGQEILRFFTVYGPNSLWAILISLFLFIFIGTRILLLGMELKASSFRKLIEKMFGFLSPFVNGYLLFAMMVINIAMLAGAGAMFEEFGKTSYTIGVLITSLVAIITIAFGIKGILSINKIVVISMLTFQIFVLLFTILTKSPFEGQMDYIEVKPPNLILKGISYASFNLILCTGVMANLGHEFGDRSVLKLGGLLGGGILGALLLSIHYCLLVHMPDVFNYEIPILFIISQLGMMGGSQGAWVFSMIYALILWGEIFTTLIGNLFSMTSFLHEKYRVHHLLSATIIICFAIILAPLGFSSIVDNIYPVLGLIGVIFIIAILFTSRRSKI